MSTETEVTDVVCADETRFRASVPAAGVTLCQKRGMMRSGHGLTWFCNEGEIPDSVTSEAHHAL